MRIFLVRHGNTFGPGDKVVWVGARTDLDLTPEGRAQAKAVGKALKFLGAAPGALYFGPLKRTVQSAEEINELFGLSPDRCHVCEELREIDYGTWEGRSNDDIRADHGSEAIDGWQKRNVWPDGFNWSPSLDRIKANWAGLIGRVIAGREAGDAVIVSSNGIFKLVAEELGIPKENAKMATGSISVLNVSETGVISVELWSQRPGQILPD